MILLLNYSKVYTNYSENLWSFSMLLLNHSALAQPTLPLELTLIPKLWIWLTDFLYQYFLHIGDLLWIWQASHKIYTISSRHPSYQSL